MKAIKELLKRVISGYPKDPFSIQNEIYNEATGAVKQIIVEPVVKNSVTADTQIPFGAYVKITGTSYTLRLLGKDYDTNRVYRKYDRVVQSGRIWIAQEDNVTGTFDANMWADVAPSTVGPVTVVAGSVVCCGRYHNNVNAIGFLIDDDSEIKKSE
jgi:hypothetical protein